MDSLALNPSLLLSCILRIALEGSNNVLLAENLLTILLLVWSPSLWTTFTITLTVSLGLVFYETRLEYMNPDGNVRETGPNNTTGIENTLPIAHELEQLADHPISNLGVGMCPFKFPISSGPIYQVPNSPLPITQSTIEHTSETSHGLYRETSDISELHGRPILFPCHLKHHRVTPFKDNFQHSYLYVGMPVGLHACYSPILSVDKPHDPKSKWPFRRAWFNLRAQDHAIRGGSHMTMAQKLREFLQSEGADPKEWSYAYMLTVPSVNGQVDNPLGFWYLYTADRELTAIVPELNTSYGERRMWLVRQSLPRKAESTKQTKSPYAFRGSFGKDIHVSPFMPLYGGYTIDTCDPCATPLGKLNILVTLTKPEGGPLLVTRVSSSAPGLDASQASFWEKISFIARWWYVPTCTVMTYRILAEAARIYLKAPRTWTRPEPTKTALGKPARAVERTLERSFRQILKTIVENHSSPISVTYVTPGEHSHKSETFHSLTVLSARNKVPTVTSGTVTPPDSSADGIKITLQVISPIFYSRFFHYKSPQAAFASELLDDARTRTLWSSDPTLFASILEQDTTFNSPQNKTSLLYPSNSNKWHWWLIFLLRAAPVATNYPRSTPYESFKGLSDIDRWVLQNCSPEEVRGYRRATFRIFLGEWIGGAIWPLSQFSSDLEPFGLSRDAVLRIYDAIIKSVVFTGIVEAAVRHHEGYGTLSMSMVGWIISGVNLWACLKACM
ncbi:hypothetical protein F5884DRAFT_900883 [Xylogone sp. PMI_703]|nr:hypothetical protein F5884DRAFT_900883 [Xylogone sp. PMI_703]